MQNICLGGQERGSERGRVKMIEQRSTSRELKKEDIPTYMSGAILR